MKFAEISETTLRSDGNPDCHGKTPKSRVRGYGKTLISGLRGFATRGSDVENFSTLGKAPKSRGQDAQLGIRGISLVTCLTPVLDLHTLLFGQAPPSSPSIFIFI